MDKPNYFYWGSLSVPEHLLKQAILKPGVGRYKRLRSHAHLGNNLILINGIWHNIKIVSAGMTGYYIECKDKESLKPIYRLFCQTLKYLRSIAPTFEKTIIKPILPQSIYDFIQTSVFDYFEAIDDFGTPVGFGNVGIILTGPPGVGKSETMRWLKEVAYADYNRGSYTLSLGELVGILNKGTPINTERVLVFLDDIDSNLLRDRRETNNPLTSQFLTCLDGLEKQEGRVIVASTNESIENIDPALRRPGRFEHIIHLDYPDLHMVRNFCKSRKIEEVDPVLFEGWSFARLDMFLSKFKVAQYRHQTTMPVFYERFIHEMGSTDPTVSAFQETLI